MISVAKAASYTYGTLKSMDYNRKTTLKLDFIYISWCCKANSFTEELKNQPTLSETVLCALHNCCVHCNA